MRKKSIILLTSTILGLGLIGGTLAGWAVTDNADPLNIGISPGTISTDTTTSYITLSWGSSQNIGNVSNLKLDETRRAGVLDLRADSATTDVNVSGDLSISITGDATLKTYLKVDVYKGNIPNYSASSTYAKDDLVIYDKAVYKAKAAITPAEEWTAGHWEVDDTNKVTFTAGKANIPLVDQENMNVANPYTVIAYLSGANQSTYDTMRSSNAQVQVTFDWGIGTGVPLASGHTIFFKGIAKHGTLSDAPYIYAFKGEDVVNAAWPGVQMEAAKIDGWYTIELDTTKYDYVVFNDGQASGGIQTDDLEVSKLYVENADPALKKNGYIYGESSNYTYHDDTVEVAYYLVGINFTVSGKETPSGWSVDDGYKVTLNNEGTATATITTSAVDARLKFYEVASGIWYSNDGNDFVIHDTGTYTITFKPNGSPVIACA